MDSGINDMAQTMNVTINGIELTAKATKEAINFMKNLLMLIVHAVQYGNNKRLENAKGEVNAKKLDKISKNQDFVRISNDPESREKFLQLCKQHRIPVAEVKGIENGKYIHFLYASEHSQKIESVMEFMQEYATKKFQKEGMSKEDAEKKAKDENRKESKEEAGMDLGCNLPHEEFKQKFLAEHATKEEKEYYAALEKREPQIDEQKKTEIKKAVDKNENRRKSHKFENDGLYTVIFDKDQIIGTVERNNENFVKVRFENDYSQAFLVNKKNIVKYGEKLYGAFDRNGDITIFDIKNNSEKTVRFNDFMSESEKYNTANRSDEKSQSKSQSQGKSAEIGAGQSVPALPNNNDKGKKKGNR